MQGCTLRVLTILTQAAFYAFKFFYDDDFTKVGRGENWNFGSCTLEKNSQQKKAAQITEKKL